jgi:hypothetical protein
MNSFDELKRTEYRIKMDCVELFGNVELQANGVLRMCIYTYTRTKFIFRCKSGQYFISKMLKN